MSSKITRPRSKTEELPDNVSVTEKMSKEQEKELIVKMFYETFPELREVRNV